MTACLFGTQEEAAAAAAALLHAASSVEDCEAALQQAILMPPYWTLVPPLPDAVLAAHTLATWQADGLAGVDTAVLVCRRKLHVLQVGHRNAAIVWPH